MAAELSGTFDPSKLIVTMGPVIIDGWSDGDYITVQLDEDLYFKRVGADGAVARTRNANRSGTIEVRTLATSDANVLLSALFATDNLAGGSAVVPFGCADLSGTSLASASQAWIKTMPALVFSKEPGERIWVFDAADLKMFIGGNNV